MPISASCAFALLSMPISTLRKCYALVRVLLSCFCATAAQNLVRLCQNVAYLLGSKLWCLTLTSAEIFRLLRESRVIRLGVRLLLGRKQPELILRRFAMQPRGRQTVRLRSITVLI